MLRILIIPVFFGLVLISCSRNNSADNSKTVFKYNESQGISTLDPAFANKQVLIWAVSQLYNGLVQLNDNLGIEPALAKKWEILDAGKKYRFILRKDVRFHDNVVFKNEKARKVTAFDVEYSLGRITDSRTASPGSWIFNSLERTENKNGFCAINDSVFEIYLTTPFPAFLGLLTMPYCYVVPKEAVDYYGEDFRKNPVGTGPFKYKYWKEGEKLIFVKNENYFENDNSGNKLPYLDAVTIRFIADKQSEFLEFLQGNLDMLRGVQTSYKNELLTKSGKLNPTYNEKIIFLKSDYLNTEYLGFMVDENLDVFKENIVRYKKIRQAINCGFDREKMMTYLRNKIGTPGKNGFIPKGLPGFDSGMVMYGYNPAKAKQLIREVVDKEGITPEITLTTTSEYLDLCEFIQHELSQAGLTINIDVSVGATFREMVSNSKLPFFRGSWIADYPDAENYLALFYSKNLSPNGPNYTHYQSEIYDKLYEQSMLETDEAKRIVLYKEMNKLIMKEAVVVPIYYDQAVIFHQKNIQGLILNPINMLNLKKVRKTK